MTKAEITEKELDDISDFPIYKAFEYQDKGGVYELLLCENQKTVSKKDKNWNFLPQKIKTYLNQLVIKLKKEQDLLLKDG